MIDKKMNFIGYAVECGASKEEYTEELLLNLISLASMSMDNQKTDSINFEVSGFKISITRGNHK